MFGTSNSTITQNKISGTQFDPGMEMFGVTSTTIGSNIINNTGASAIYIDDFGSGGNTIKANTILEAPCAIQEASVSGDVLSPNTLLGVVATTCP
jgi:hypothetical protein